MIDEIIKALHVGFPEAKIYTEKVEQGFQEPCFLISDLSTKGNLEIKNRLRVSKQIMIQFFPVPYTIQGTHTEREQCSSVADKLIPLLLDLQHYHANAIDASVDDDILNVEFWYTKMTVSVPESDAILDYSQRFSEKGDAK